MKVNNVDGVQRFVVVFVTFLGVINVYMMRNSLGLTMTKLKVKPKPKSFNFNEQFDWSSNLKSAIHASFYIGYVLGHIPGAYLAAKFGAKTVLNVGLFLTALFTAITPFVIELGGPYGLIAMRFLMGLGEAPAFPAIGGLLSAWVPPKERGLSSAFVLGGVQMGSLLSSLLSGEILYKTEGWGTIFFIFGGIGFAWNILFHFTVSSKPANHARIGNEEKEYLHQEIGELVKTRKHSDVPWSSLLTSKPVWALIIAQLGHDWALFFQSSYTPTILTEQLKMTVKEAGRYGALGYFVAWVFSIFCGYLGGYLIRRRQITITNSRKLFTVLSTIVPGSFFVLVAYFVDYYTVAVLCMIFSIGTMGAFYAGNRVNVLDICPNYTAALLGFVNGLGAIAGIIALFSTGLLTPNQTIDEWKIVFWIMLAVLVATTAVYLWWASGEIQSWNDNPDEDNWLKRFSTRKIERAEVQQRNDIESTSHPNVVNAGLAIDK